MNHQDVLAMLSLRPSFRAVKSASKGLSRSNSTASAPSPPRHFLSAADVSPQEFAILVKNAAGAKSIVKADHGSKSLFGALSGKTVSLTFSKRSTRTRVSTEAAVAHMGGHAMFLGRDDIQLGVNESLYDTSRVISSMVAAMVARVGPHSDVAELAKHSSVPVINALSDDFHPLQSIANMLTAYQTFNPEASRNGNDGLPKSDLLGLQGLKMAWVGDANNVLYDIAIACQKLGIHLSVATPKGFEVPKVMHKLILEQGRAAAATIPDYTPPQFTTTNVPEEAVKDANMIVTDTWVSMGQESEKAHRIKQFEGFQVTSELAKRGGAAEDWVFMHCLPRKPEEVSDEVFHNPKRSLVFQEAENRLYGMISVLKSFVVDQGKIKLG